MKRLPKGGRKQDSSKNQQPDFYVMAKVVPLQSTDPFPDTSQGTNVITRLEQRAASHFDSPLAMSPQGAVLDEQLSLPQHEKIEISFCGGQDCALDPGPDSRGMSSRKKQYMEQYLKKQQKELDEKIFKMDQEIRALRSKQNMMFQNQVQLQSSITMNTYPVNQASHEGDQVLRHLPASGDTLKFDDNVDVFPAPEIRNRFPTTY
jgi:hypothetical protein